MTHPIVFTELVHCPACGRTKEAFSLGDYKLILPYFQENMLDPSDSIRDLTVERYRCTYTHGSMITSEFWGTEENEKALKDWFRDRHGTGLDLRYNDEPSAPLMCADCDPE